MTDPAAPLNELIRRLRSTIDRAEASEPGERPQRSSVPIRRYVLGLTSLATLQTELADQGYAGTTLARLAASAIREHQLHAAELAADTIEAEFKAGSITASNLQARYEQIGYQPDEALARSLLAIAREGPGPEARTAVGLAFFSPSGNREIAAVDSPGDARQGDTLAAHITLAVADSGALIADRLVVLQRFDPAVSDYIDIGQAVTDVAGAATVALQAPPAPGRYRYRARYPGNPGEFRPDTSRQVILNVA